MVRSTLPADKIYAVGGANASDPLGTLEIFDPLTNTWSARRPMPTPRRSLAAAVANGRMYAIGGDLSQIVEEYDPISDAWVSRPSLLTGRSGCAASVFNGSIFVMGGYGLLASVEQYNPSTHSWSYAPSMPWYLTTL
jgi:N-acetylneuraminic acid mutarotase